MRFVDEKRDAIRLLTGLENGGLAPADATILGEDLDPVYVYVIVSFLRAVYPAADPAASSVLERVVRLTASSPAVVQKHREGGRDPVTAWVESEHPYAEYRGRGIELLELVADKLDS